MEINFLKKQGNFTKFEFWGFVLLFAFGLFIFITNKFEEDGMIANEPFRSYFEASNTPYSFYRNFFIPQIVQLSVLFFAFVFLNFMVIPGFAQRRSLVKSVIVLVVVFLVTVAIVFICNTYLQAYLYTSDTQAKANGEIIRVSLENTLQVFMMLIVYTLIKYTGLYLLSIADFIHKKIKYVTKEAIVAAIIWLILQLLLIAGRADTELILGWVIIIPYGIIFYSYAFHTLIPQMLTKERAFVAYLLQSAFIIAVCFLPVFLIVLAASRYEARTFSISFLNTVIQLFITVPLTWLLYNRQQKGNEEMNFLKKELKQSTANIDFLRSQINPHFLFNAMNTLYGTAIQENAERTSEGIQKLADMMRFMLQENVQEKIGLSREIDYLENYIDLQRLRINANPNINIQANINAREAILQIAPMLLIPFVENAFKHGISFREPSHIKINLEVKDRTLYFDVHNSKHNRQHNDPEKDKSGIGLENVRQRLILLYPDKHELITRDTTQEFFIHLTIQLA